MLQTNIDLLPQSLQVDVSKASASIDGIVPPLDRRQLHHDPLYASHN